MASEKPKTTEVKLLEPKPLDLTTLGPLILLVALNILIPFLLRDRGALAFPASAFVLVVTAVLVIFLRTLPTQSIKMAAYMAVGFAVYWNVGSAYTGAMVGPTVLSASDQPLAYTTPAALGLATVILFLIILNEGPSRASFFSLMGFAIALFPVATGKVAIQAAAAPALILLFVLWTLTTFVTAKGLAGGSKTKYKTPEKIKAGIRGALVSSPLYLVLLMGLLIATEMFKPQGPTISQAVPAALRNIGGIVELGKYLGVGVAFYVLLQFLVVAIVMLLYDGVLSGMHIERQLLKTGDIRFIRRVAPEPVLAAAPKEKKVDNYVSLIADIRKLLKNLETTDRLNAAQLIQRYKSEHEILAGKNSPGSREAAEKALKELETAFERKYG